MCQCYSRISGRDEEDGDSDRKKKNCTNLQHGNILPNTLPAPLTERDPEPLHILRGKPAAVRRGGPVDPARRVERVGVGAEGRLVEVHGHGGHAYCCLVGGSVSGVALCRLAFRGTGKATNLPWQPCPRNNAPSLRHIPRQVDRRGRSQPEGFLDTRLQVGQTAQLGVCGRLGIGGVVSAREGVKEFLDEAAVDVGVAEDVVEGVA